jgi:GT2 family glycosyltransferase
MVKGADVIVVDNASTDGTLTEVNRRRSSLRLIANKDNRGFAAAVNQGFHALSTPLVLMLNPDTVIQGGTEELERAVLSNERTAGATGLLLGENGEPQHGFNVRALPTPATLIFEVLGINRLFPFNPVNRKYRMQVDTSAVTEIDQPAGAFLMVRRSVWADIGGLDEGFTPVWFEDVDFCKRLHDGGFRILFVPAATAVHLGGQSVSQMPWVVRQKVWYGSLLRYASKHFGVTDRRAVAAAVIVGCIARCIIRAVTQLSFEPLTACGTVIRLASLNLRLGDRGGASEAACSKSKGK